MVTKAWAVSRSAESPWAFHQLAKQALNPTSCRAVASSQVQAAWHKGTKRSAGEACSEQLFGRHGSDYEGLDSESQNCPPSPEPQTHPKSFRV